MKKIFFIVVAISGVFIMSCNSNAPTRKSETQSLPVFKSEKETVSVKEAFELSKANALIIDVRDSDEIAELAYDVKDIKSIPVDNLENHLTEIPKDRQVIVACKSGTRSARAFDLFKTHGFNNIANMEGGMNAWYEAGLPTLKNGAKSTTYRNTQQKRLEVYCFHGTRQCETCKNMKANTKATLDQYFTNQLKDGSITFSIIDIDDKKNERLAEKFQATGTALMINRVVNGKDSIVDWSDFAFDEANDKEKFVAALKLKIDGILK